jgi:spermidine synthase
MTQALLISVFLIATCGLVYELLASTLASYLLGDTVTQFSTVIGTYMFSMGIGSWLSRYIGRGLVARFVQVELMVGLVGGCSTTVLFLAFGQPFGFRLVLYGLVGLTGTLVGLEIPLLLRILKDKMEFGDLVSQILTLDYLGALVASLLFPLVLVPKLGLIRSAFLFGLLNAGVALWGTWVFGASLGGGARGLRAQCIAVLGLLLAGFAYSTRLSTFAEQNLYTDDVILSRTTPYQRIIVTRRHGDIRLFLNGHLQFASEDEYRYHEPLVHPGLCSLRQPKRVLVLGGGDGLAVREILKTPSIEAVTLVDLDPAMTALFRDNALLAGLNGGAFKDPRVRVINDDAFVWVNRSNETFDFIVVDFPDPSNFSLGKLYSTAFYHRLLRHLRDEGHLVVQSTSPLYARRSYWCIDATLRNVGLVTRPYHVYVPSFGEWGYILASRHPFELPDAYPAGLRYLNPATARTLFDFSEDTSRVVTDVNRLNNQVLVHYYDEEWHHLQ